MNEPTPAFTADDLQQYRHYLRVLARTQIGPQYQAKVDASDVVQQTMIQAYEALSDFRGSDEAEFKGWLRQILLRTLLHEFRRYKSGKRDVAREREMAERMDRSSMNLERFLAGSEPSPSFAARFDEERLRLIAMLDELPEIQRRAIELHYLEEKTLAEVAVLLDKTPGSIAGLIHRGLKQLREKGS